MLHRAASLRCLRPNRRQLRIGDFIEEKGPFQTLPRTPDASKRPLRRAVAPALKRALDRRPLPFAIATPFAWVDTRAGNGRTGAFWFRSREAPIRRQSPGLLFAYLPRLSGRQLRRFSATCATSDTLSGRTARRTRTTTCCDGNLGKLFHPLPGTTTTDSWYGSQRPFAWG